MNKHLEHFLLSVLVAISVLLGLTFWLNLNFGFNLLSAEHWHELALLQASNVTIDKSFYISIAVAIFIFVISMYIIYRPRFRKIPMPRPQNIEIKTLPAIIKNTEPQPTTKETTDVKQTISEPKESKPMQTIKADEPKIEKAAPVPQQINLARPPKLNLPTNMAQIAANQYNTQMATQQSAATATQYDDALAELFSNTAYLVKKNQTITGLKTNLIAIGNHELFWVGCVDCDINKMKTLINKIKETFTQTLPDIPITVYSFILDTKKIYESDPDIFIFHDMDNVRKFIYDNQGTDISPEYQEDFDAYSEYIDTVLMLLANR